MTSRLGRGLRRFVDSLQRGLFDDVAEAPADAAARRTAAGADRLRPTVLRHPQATRELVARRPARSPFGWRACAGAASASSSTATA